MLPRYRSIASVIASCVAMGSLPAIVTMVFGRIAPLAFLQSSVTGFVYASCIALPCWAVIPSVNRRVSRRSAAVRYAAHALVLMSFAVVGCFVANLILIALHLVNARNLWPVFWITLRICLLITLTVGAMTTVILTLRGQLRSTREALHEREVAEERERKIAAEARFASLESRVRPHFLFNTLNSISALVREDPTEAERMIERLAALLRYSLDSELTGLVALREELRIVRDYIDIERVRFGARLRYSVEAEEDALTYSVPALSVQTLVENSVKYAVGASRAGAAIQVKAFLREGRLLIEVSDDGPGFESAGLKPGHGLDLLRQRLAALFGPSASLEVRGTVGQTMVAISVAV